MTGTAGQKRIPKDYFSENPFSLPPTTEQSLCYELELKLRKAREDSEKLMETVVRGLLERAAA